MSFSIQSWRANLLPDQQQRACQSPVSGPKACQKELVMVERKHFLRFVSIALGLLTAGAVIATGIMFAFSSGEKIFAQMISGKYSAFILLVQVLESVAITLAAAAFAIDILDTLISPIGGRDISSRDMVTLIR
jgi:hypothetical protein